MTLYVSSLDRKKRFVAFMECIVAVADVWWVLVTGTLREQVLQIQCCTS
jgi:hypothetical protein